MMNMVLLKPRRRNVKSLSQVIFFKREWLNYLFGNEVKKNYKGKRVVKFKSHENEVQKAIIFIFNISLRKTLVSFAHALHCHIYFSSPFTIF